MLALLFVISILLLLYLYLTYNFSEWKNKGINFVSPLPIVGSMGKVLLLREHMSDFYRRVYYNFRDEPFTGFFQGRTPALLIRDPALVKHMLIKDFSYFTDHGFTVDEDLDPLQAKNLFNMEGHRWKEMRTKLTPTFTSGRIKCMFPLVLECAKVLEKYLGELADVAEATDFKDLLARYTTDVISSCAFGVKCDSINDPHAHFRVMGRRIIDISLIQGLKNAVIIFAPEVAKWLRFQFFDEQLTIFFRNLVQSVISMRKRTGETRNDFMQLLIQLKEQGRLKPEDDTKENLHVETSTLSKLTEDDVTAQAMVFFLAGFETSSSALSFALFEMCRRPDLQQRARQDIEQVLQKHEGQLTYHALQDMKYLDWILQESLRKYPPLSVLNRVCNKNYLLPETNLSINKGTLIAIPIRAMHNDPEYFPEPEIFKPERFEDESKIHEFVYMPFGEGPRQCIGLRFARMQAKLGLVMLLKNFNLEPTELTPSKLTFNPRQFLLGPIEDIILKATRI